MEFQFLQFKPIIVNQCRKDKEMTNLKFEFTIIKKLKIKK